MGKKHKKRKQQRQAEMAAPLIGAASAVLQQANSPAGRQALAGVLRAAADVIGGVRTAGAANPPGAPMPPRPPVAPVETIPPVPPVAPVAPPGDGMPPQVAQVMGFAANALERWAASLGTPRGETPGDAKPH